MSSHSTTAVTVTAEPSPQRDVPVGVPAVPAVPTGGRPALLRAQVVAELRRFLRLPEYLVGVVAIPMLMYAMFGLPHAGERLPGGTQVGAMILVSFTCFGVVNQSLFSFGAELAADRGKGWLRRLRAAPMPMWAYFAGKLAMNLVFAVGILVGTTLIAEIGGVRPSPAELVRVAGVVLLGCVAFSPMGAAIAYWARPRSAGTIANLVFLPLSFASGFFFPLSGLPSVVGAVAPWLPTYHIGQLAWGAMARSDGDVHAYGNPTASSPVLDLAVIATWSAFFAVLTVIGYRRDLDRERER